MRPHGPRRATCRCAVAALLAVLLATAAASDTKWCKAKRAECERACRSGEVDFHCRDAKGGAKEVSCSCSATTVKFGHSEGSPYSPAGPAASWWPAWRPRDASPAAVSPFFPAPALLGGQPLLPTYPPADSPMHTVGLAIGAACISSALVGAVAGLAWLLFRAWRALTGARRRRRAHPTGTTTKPPPSGLDLEAADHPDAAVLPHEKA